MTPRGPGISSDQMKTDGANMGRSHAALLWMVIGVVGLCTAARLQAQHWSWEQAHAEVDPRGDLAWTPEPFAFETGASVRYIDFADGSDRNPGTKARPWKHHPWDPQATGQAAACEGIHTYVFKRGVVYRGTLRATESGEPGEPIRLTSDPAWGAGEAVLCGSETVTDWRKGADHEDIPEADKVWYTDLDYAPRCVWMVAESGEIVRIPLARTPNWELSDEDDVKSEWWHWDYAGEKPFDVFTETADGKKLYLGVDKAHLTEPAEYYENALVWTEYGWVMGTPYPARVEVVDTERKGLGFGGQWGGVGSYKIVRYNRYYLEDKPHYLDSPGEFWFDKSGQGGRLYIRLPDDANPNRAQVEAARHMTLIDSEGMSHVQISGLTFRFTNVYWALDAGPYVSKDVDPACIRLLGSGRDIEVANCLFEHVHLPIRMKAVGANDAIDNVVVRDNEFRWTDHGAVNLEQGGEWGIKDEPIGRLYDVKVLRNRCYQIGMRPNRFGQGHALEVSYAQTMEVAGNVLDRCYGSGIFVFGGKPSGYLADRPLSRMLVHHNKVTNPMLNNNDWGGIETWQGGPAYVYNNISGNPGGYWHYNFMLNQGRPARARFGHAYYLDGAFKNYHFNNIAWGKSSDPYSRLGNTAAFQEIHSYQNTFFNNTVYNFVKGTRRQSPHAGRDKFLGNVWDSIGEWLFWHANPADSPEEGNAADAGPQKSHFALETNAYARNVFRDVSSQFAVFEPSGRWHESLDSFRSALAEEEALVATVGKMSRRPVLRDPGNHDFRLATDSSAIDMGVKAFVPWGLYATVGEWHFYPAGDDPSRILDEHWTMTRQHNRRDNYHELPMYPLTAVNVSSDDYVSGPLEDWIEGSLRLNGRDQYAVLPHERLEAAPPHPETSSEPATIPESYEWVSIEAPAEVTPGERFEVSLRLHGVEAGGKIGADLHWQKVSGAHGGFSAWGGPAREVTGEGPYVFSFRPEDKPELGSFSVLVHVGPTGNWADRTREARFTIGRRMEQPLNEAPLFRSPRIGTSNVLLEVFFRTAPGHTDGVLVEKMDATGYSLATNARGGVTFALAGDRAAASVDSLATVNDGAWHHLIAEADREAGTLTLYVDGKEDATDSGIGPDVSLANAADLFVGGTPSGRWLAGELEFLRICQGTLADAKTSIKELYAWQFDGPFLRDFTGQEPADRRRDAGALESEE